MNGALVEMFEYNRWATRTLIEACRELSDDVLDADVPGVSGSVRQLLAHIVGGQQSQVLRTKGRQHEGELSRSSKWPGFPELLRLAEESSAALVEAAGAIEGEPTADLPWMGKTYRFPVSFFLAHAMEHGVEHRTEIKVALGSLGIETPDLDGWAYAAARGYGLEVAG